jgi:hypothetical protein
MLHWLCYPTRGINKEQGEKYINVIFIFFSSVVLLLCKWQFIVHIIKVQIFRICILNRGIRDTFLLDSKGFWQCWMTQNYWGFGLLPLSRILGNRGHDVSETGSVSFFRWERKTPTQLVPLERANLNHWTTPVRFTQLFQHIRLG